MRRDLQRRDHAPRLTRLGVTSEMGKGGRETAASCRSGGVLTLCFLGGEIRKDFFDNIDPVSGDMPRRDAVCRLALFSGLPFCWTYLPHIAFQSAIRSNAKAAR